MKERALTYDQFMKLARENYDKGGDSYVECWDERTFAYLCEGVRSDHEGQRAGCFCTGAGSGEGRAGNRPGSHEGGMVIVFNINDMASLRAAYSFVRTLREVTVPVENVARRDRHIADVKREIREFTHRPAPDSRIIEEHGINGYIELVRLPDELDDLNEDDAAEWFQANRYYEFRPTPYDCSGQRFTNWYKLHRRCGHWFAYHSVSFDV